MSLLKGNNKYEAARELQEAYEKHTKQKNVNKKWINYLFLGFVGLIITFYLTNFIIDCQFIKNSKKAHAKIKTIEFISSTDGSGLGSTSTSFERIVYTYRVNDSVYENFQDIYDLNHYFDFENLNRDSIFILYDQRNPQNSRFSKLKD